MIVSCGEALVDLLPDPVPGGGPMNVAIAAARLGAPSAFVGRVSTDEHGERIWRHLASNGVDLRATQRGPEPTARAIVEHVPQLRFRFEGDDTADTCLDHVDLDVLGAGPHLVHGGTLGLFRGTTAETLARLAERHDGVVSLDPNVRPQIIDDRARWRHFHDRWLARAHLYRGSDEDLAWVWPGRSTDSIAAELVAGQQAAVIVTRGGDGAQIYTRHGERTVGGVETTVVDTVGAGDTFVASVLVQLHERGLAGDPGAVRDLPLDAWADIVAFAVTAAAITCSRAGADPPTRAELTSGT
ncbi:MAG: carbohydrate kinase [Actinomycetota bacterium]|nr:carbohydrate kinase [Actinomycetota bacterium]